MGVARPSQWQDKGESLADALHLDPRQKTMQPLYVTLNSVENFSSSNLCRTTKSFPKRGNFILEIITVTMDIEIVVQMKQTLDLHYCAKSG